MANKFLIIQSFAYNRGAESYTGRQTQINVGVVTEDWQKKFLETLRQLKKQDSGGYNCHFHVFCGDGTAFEIYPWRETPALEWHIGAGLNPAQKDEMVIEMGPDKLAETDCSVSRCYDCPVCIASGKCPAPFIRKYIGKVFFPNQYEKQH